MTRRLVEIVEADVAAFETAAKVGLLATLSPECCAQAKSILSGFSPGTIVNMTSLEDDARLGEKLKSSLVWTK